MIKNHNIVITGTSRGIGNKLTKKFLKNGNYVWGCSRNDTKINNKKYFHSKLDLTKEKQVKKWIEKIEKKTQKKIDIFISNAAIYESSLNILDNDKSIYKTIKTNLIAPMLITSLVSRIMSKRKNGTIIFLSSAASILNDIGTSAYASSKSGLETFSAILNKELKIFNIKVFTLRILYIKTKLSMKLKNNQVKILKNKFKSNIFGSIDKIYSQICKINNSKGKLNNALIFDKKTNKRKF